MKNEIKAYIFAILLFLLGTISLLYSYILVIQSSVFFFVFFVLGFVLIFLGAAISEQLNLLNSKSSASEFYVWLRADKTLEDCK